MFFPLFSPGANYWENYLEQVRNSEPPPEECAHCGGKIDEGNAFVLVGDPCPIKRFHLKCLCSCIRKVIRFYFYG